MDCVTDEVLLNIFQHLNTDDINQLARINKRFYRITRDPALNRVIAYQRNFHVSSTILHKKVCLYGDSLQSLTLQDCFWIPSFRMVAALQRCTKLKELILTGSHLSLNGLVKIVSSNLNLIRLGWSIPNTSISSELQKDGTRTDLFNKVQAMFKRFSGILLRFESLMSFEQFLPIFDTQDFYVNEFGLEYLSERSSSYFTIGNTYGIYVKCNQKFQICLSDAIDANRFLHFNLLVMDFVIQIVTKAAQANDILMLLAPGNINSPCWKFITTVWNSISFERIDMSYCNLDKEQMTWLSKLTNITHLNLSDVHAFKANLMKVIAINCAELKALNLCHCDDWIEKDLRGLDAIATYCRKLMELNLSCLHIHAGPDDLNKLCSIISNIPTLKTLSIPPCSLINNINLNDKSGSSPLQRSNFNMYKPQVLSNLVLSESASSSLDISDLTRKLRSSQEDDLISNESGLDTIFRSCINVEELEIIDTGFHSAFSKLSTKQDQFFCPTTIHLKDKHFLPISTLRNLRKLTLAGLSGVGSFNSLVQITNCCTELEVLSIAHCSLSGHSGALSSLRQALMNCKKLKTFRLDQPHFFLRDQFLEALCTCKRLEVLCIISKNGKSPKDPKDYFMLFEQCPRLVAFFLFSGSIISDARKIQSTLKRKYGHARPPLCVTILPYYNALTEEGLCQVPYVYVRDVIRFESRIASCKYDS